MFLYHPVASPVRYYTYLLRIRRVKAFRVLPILLTNRVLPARLSIFLALPLRPQHRLLIERASVGFDRIHVILLVTLLVLFSCLL